MKKILFLFILFFFSFYSYSQQSSCTLKISLLTCSPGNELYSTFGHTAIRVTDSIAGTDIVFNYGTFEFGPDFYSEFIQGKLLYYLSIQNYSDFLYAYQWEQRSIIEQVLNLNCEETDKLYTALQANAQNENRYYRYDFLFDNCSTRPAEIIVQNTNRPVVFKDILPEEKPTFRNLIHSYLNKGQQYWSKFGIDMLLGAKLDRKITTKEAMFLPDYLMKAFDSAVVGSAPLVQSKQPVLQMPNPKKNSALFRPEIIFSLILVLIVVLQFSKAKWTKKFLSVFDFVFFFILGLAGFLILFMWFGTDHLVCQNNLNIIWTLPTHAIMAFAVHKNSETKRKYFLITMILSAILLFGWFFIPQQLNPSVIPILLLIIFRCLYLSKTK